MIEAKPDETLYFYINTIDSTGAPVAPSSSFTSSDFAIHKNGSSTEKLTTNGITVTSPFDSETGLHILAIDLNNDIGDDGFWENHAFYSIRFNTSTTVDGISIDGRNIPNGMFVIRPRYINEDIKLLPSDLSESKTKAISANNIKNGYMVSSDSSGNIYSEEL